MKKKLIGIAAALLAVFVLISCSPDPAEGLRGGDGADIPCFSDMEYTRPDTLTLQNAVDAVEAALDSGAAEDDVTALLDECYGDYYDFSTMYTLAEIRYLRDLTDDYYSAEYSWCGENWSVVQQLMERLYTVCAASGIADELERDYFWEGFVDDYGEGSTQLYTERAVELMQRETSF